MGLVDLIHQVKAVLPLRFGGTANPNGWGTGVVVQYLNVSGADLPIGTIVQQAGNGGARCEACDTLDSVELVGVVMGWWQDGLTLVQEDCPDQELAAVMISGRCRVLVAENVARGEYAFQSSTDGEARGDATAAAGAFGIFESTGTSGDLAYVRLFGAVILSAGGSTSPLTTKGDLYGFSTLDARIPVGTNAFVLTADSTQALGLKWAAVPADPIATLTTKGDLLTRNSSALARLGVGSNGQVLTADSAQATGLKWAQRDTGVQVVFYAPTNGMQVDWVAPCDGTITRWTALGDASGSAVIDIWKDTYANFPPTVADTITAAAKPTISAATKGQSSTLTGWTTSFSKGDIFRFNVDSVSGLSRLALAIDFTRVG